LSEKSREHIHPVMLNATFYVGITKLQARLECSKSAAILYALNEGLYKEGVISIEDYELLTQRYGRKLKEVIAAGKENSHISKLELEKQKREQCQTGALQAQTQEQLNNIDRNLKLLLEEWPKRPDLSWRIKAVNYAKKHSDLNYAKLLIEKEKECDIISHKENL
jgi:hypothetical protein